MHEHLQRLLCPAEPARCFRWLTAEGLILTDAHLHTSVNCGILAAYNLLCCKAHCSSVIACRHAPPAPGLLLDV
jgi:hypothetical protein